MKRIITANNQRWLFALAGLIALNVTASAQTVFFEYAFTQTAGTVQDIGSVPDIGGAGNHGTALTGDGGFFSDDVPDEDVYNDPGSYSGGSGILSTTPTIITVADIVAANGITLEAWAKNGGAVQKVISVGNIVELSTVGNPAWGYQFENNWAGSRSYVRAEVEIDLWHHMVGVLDDVTWDEGSSVLSANMYFYVDGEMAGAPAPLTITGELNRPVSVGGHPTANVDNFTGLIYHPKVTLGVVHPELNPVASIVTNTTALDMGAIDLESASTRSVSIFNAGGVDLTVDATIGAGGGQFAVVEGANLTLAPGETAEVVVSFDSNGVIGDFTGTLVLASNDPDDPTLVVDLAGTAYQPGMVAHYNFDEGTEPGTPAADTPCIDSSDNAFSGTYRGSNISTGHPGAGTATGTSAEFNGSDDYVELGVSKALNSLSTNFTVSAWIKPRKFTHTRDDGQVVPANIIGARSTNWRIALNENANGPVIRYTALTIVDIDVQAPELTTGTWQHLAVVVSPEQVDFYLNGSHFATTGPGNSNTDPTISWTIGRLENAEIPHEYFNGFMDDIRIYDAPLNAGKIAMIFASANPSADAKIATAKNIDFGSVDANSQTPTSVDVVNVGGQELTYTTSITGPDADNFAVVGGASNTLAPEGGEDIITVAVSPDGVLGQLNAELVISSNDPSSPTITVPMTAYAYFSGLVAHYELNETDSPSSGAVAVDSSGNMNDGIYAGNVTLNQTSAGPSLGTAASFAGADESVLIGRVPLFEGIKRDFSVCAWVNPTALEGIQNIFGGGGGDYRGWRLGLTTDRILFTTLGVQDIASNPLPLVAGEWQHVGVVYTPPVIEYYLNGELVQTRTDAALGSTTSNISWRIGSLNTGEWFNGAIDDVQIYDLPLTSDQMGQIAAFQSVNLANIVINEVMYNPEDGDPYEFIELYNSGKSEADLAGWTLAGGVDFVFPAGSTINPGGYLVVVASTTDFDEKYGFTNGVVGDWTGNLSDLGATIQIFDASEKLMDEVIYRPWAPWPEDANGFGPSLELFSPFVDNWNAAYWLESSPPENGGTPGEQNSQFQAIATPEPVIMPTETPEPEGTPTPTATPIEPTPATPVTPTPTVTPVEPTETPVEPTPTVVPTPTPTPIGEDTDGDGRGDACETDDLDLLLAPGATITNILLPDSDNDGLLDGQEDPGDCADQTTPLALTNPRKKDTDGDGFSDGLEVLILGSDPLDAASPADATDADGDGLPASIDPDDNNIDTDGDGFGDAFEVVMGSDPEDAGSVPALGDVNGDGISQNLDAIMIFNYSLGNVPIGALTTFGNADVQTSGHINNLDGIVLFNWTLGNVPVIPVG